MTLREQTLMHHENYSRWIINAHAIKVIVLVTVTVTSVRRESL